MNIRASSSRDGILIHRLRSWLKSHHPQFLHALTGRPTTMFACIAGTRHGLRRWLVFGSLLGIFTGCASTGVQPLSFQSGPETFAKPDRILVDDFAVSPAAVSLDDSLMATLGGTSDAQAVIDERMHVGQAVAAALSEELVKRIRALGLPAERGSGGPSPTEGTLALEGVFLSIDEGNRLRRTLIGFGAGASHVRTAVRVSLGSARGPYLLQEFKTNAESPKRPGMAETMGVGAAVRGVGLARAAVTSGGVHAATAFRETVEADARRTAAELVKRLAPFWAAQGWIAKDRAR
jgi:hypothetical protein